MATIEDLEVAKFATEIELDEKLQEGEDVEDYVDLLYRLQLCDYSADELLHSVHRHVKALVIRNRQKNNHHLQMLNRVSDEIQRRLLLETQHESS